MPVTLLLGRDGAATHDAESQEESHYEKHTRIIIWCVVLFGSLVHGVRFVEGIRLSLVFLSEFGAFVFLFLRLLHFGRPCGRFL